MKKDRQIEIQEDIFKYAWEKYKNELTMQVFVDEILKPTLTTFFRRVKKNENKNNS